MQIKPRTVIVFLVMLGFVYALVKLVSFKALVLFFNVLLVFINSVFLFAFFEVPAQQKQKPQKWPFISIVVPNYNGEKTLRKCLDAVKAMRYSGRKEIIVVDDGSKDSSVKILRAISGIKLIAKKQNAGKGAALNAGIAACRGDAIVTIDSDTYPAPDSLEKMVPLLRLEDGIGAVTGFVRAANAKGIVEKIQQVEYLVAFGFFQSVLSDINAILVTPGPMSVYSAKAMGEIGGFDEANITEDMEIAFRLRSHGYKIVTNTDTKIYTEVPTTVTHLFRQRVRWYRGKFFNTVKYGNMLFNPKFGEFGMFTFPFSVIVEWCVVLFVFIFIAANIENAGRFAGLLAQSYSLGIDLSTVAPSLLLFDSSLVFYFIGACFYIFFLYLSHIIAKDDIGLGKLPELFVFIALYGFFILAVFFYGFLKEINASDYAW